ncbi:hypothetical protein QUA62_27820, partial [Microcoleus sp. MON1_C1]
PFHLLSNFPILPEKSIFTSQMELLYEQGDTLIRKVAARLDVSKGFVQKFLKQKQATGHVQPKQQGGSPKSVLHSRTTELTRW